MWIWCEAEIKRDRRSLIVADQSLVDQIQLIEAVARPKAVALCA
jgi:hypothetical protein